jgi:hypothetical protein
MAELLSILSGVLLSLAASYLPGFSAWFAALDGIRKRILLAALGLLAVVGVMLAGCAGWYNYPCSEAGALELLRAYAMLLIANQATYTATPSDDK